VYILRGLPGSGKSYLAEEIRQLNGNDIPIVSLDNFFTGPDGTYKLEGERVQEGIENLKSQLVAILTSGQSAIMDNTHSRLVEYEDYIALAKRYRCRVVIRQILCPNEATLQIFLQRCRHQVTEEVMRRMQRRWEKDDRAILLTPFI